MAIPGSILAPQSAGCHALIRQGAALVDSPGAPWPRNWGRRPRRLTRPVACSRAPTTDAAAEPGHGAPSADPVLAGPGPRPAVAGRPGRPLRLAGPQPCRPTCSRWSSTARWPGCRAACTSGAAPPDAGRRAAFPAVAEPCTALGHQAGCGPGRGGIVGPMFEVLVYLYENYWRPDACPDHDQLTRKLSAVGFESDEIQEALVWLDGLAENAQAYAADPVGRQPAGVFARPRSTAWARIPSASSAFSNRPACCHRPCARW